MCQFILEIGNLFMGSLGWVVFLQRGVGLLGLFLVSTTCLLGQPVTILGA